ncbi:MAG TPA: dispase autolysis-inducing protein [Thermoanaerobaculia bacterium]|nr:dispase autolysis-inducing protein [Thermoanaerobaculia bacterium]
MRRLLILSLLFSTAALAAPRRRVVGQPCSLITGTPGVTITRNEGVTLTPTAERLTGVGYTYGLAALDATTLLAWHKETLSLSTDAGCSWRPVGQWQTDFPPSITSAGGGRAFAWSDNREFLLRYDARGPQVLKAPATIVGLGAQGDHVRLGDADGALWDSIDGGDSFAPISRLPLANPTIVYRFAFDPANLDHVIAGTASQGAFVTFDGGRNWSRTSLADGFNVMNFAISPADPNVVWAMAVDGRNGTKAIHGSKDGGLTFVPVVQAGAGVTIVNQPVMAAHPTNPNVFYFVFGSHFQGYGTDLFRYDALSGLTMTHNSNHDINSIAFSPADPTVMYLGLEVEFVGG